MLEERAAELRIAGALGRLLAVCAEDASLVAVERQRLAVSLDIGARGGELCERRFGWRKQQLHQLASCVIDIDQQRARRRAVLEPRMVNIHNSYNPSYVKYVKHHVRLHPSARHARFTSLI